MAQCKKCGAEGRYDLCHRCYKEQREDAPINDNDETDAKGSNPSKNLSFQENMIKGRIAETLIEELFLAIGYNVFRYGMENTIPGVMKLLRGVRGDVADSIKRMPDFVVQDRKGEVYFIEVKFRANETFAKADLPSNYPYYNAYIVLVSKKTHQVHHRAGAGGGQGDIAHIQELPRLEERVRSGQGYYHQLL